MPRSVKSALFIHVDLVTNWSNLRLLVVNVYQYHTVAVTQQLHQLVSYEYDLWLSPCFWFYKLWKIQKVKSKKTESICLFCLAGTSPPSCCPIKSKPCDDCGKCFTEEQECNLNYKDFCEDGTIMKNCPCLVNGTMYKHGEEIEVGQCTECLCNHGELKCEKVYFVLCY